MSLPDETMEHWFQLAADFDPDRVSSIIGEMESGKMHPNEAKRLLARSVVELYHGAEAAKQAEAEFDEIFKRGGTPTEIESFPLPTDDPINLPALIREAFEMSGSEARRMIQQGAVKVGGEPVSDLEVARARLRGQVMQVGKRKFVQLGG
jgi:tyrosyl-tRNA synthetase